MPKDFDDSNVSKLNNNERLNFHGNTIEDSHNPNTSSNPQFFQDCADAEDKNGYYQAGSYSGNSNRRSTIRIIRLGSNNKSRLSQLLWTVGIGAILGLFLFFAIPALIAVVGVAIVILFIKQFLKK